MDFLNTFGHKLAKSRKLQVSLLLVFLVVIVGVMIPRPAQAEVLQRMGYIIAGLMWPIVWLFGRLIEMMIWLIIQITSYNGFINASAVKIGWYLVRDICNLFFIIVLLTIAISTVLGIERYSYRNLLGKFILMVILINFSRLIAGFWIDLSQVIMMTFVTAFRDYISAGIFNGAGIQNLLHLNEGQIGNSGALSISAVIGSVLLAAIMVVVMFFVLLALFVIFLVRIVMLWILIILSPLSYLTYIFPGGKPQNSKYWQMFWQYITVGPVLAFFLWLSIMMIYESKGNPSNGILNSESERAQTFLGNDTKYAAITEITEAGNFLNYGMTIALLVFAMMFAQQSGVAGASFAKKAAGAVTALPFKGIKNLAGFANSKLGARTGINLNAKDWVTGIREKMDAGRIRDKRRTVERAGAALRKGGLGGQMIGWTGATRDAAENYLQGPLALKGARQAWRHMIHPAGNVEGIQSGLDQKQDKLTELDGKAGDLDLSQEERRELWRERDSAERQMEAFKHDEELYPNDPEITERKEAKAAEVRKLEERLGDRSLAIMSEEDYSQTVGNYRKEKNDLLTGIKDDKTLLSKVQPPLTAYADREARALYAEEQSKYPTSNEDELIMLGQKFLQNGDQVQFAATFLQAAKAGHTNEFINHVATASKNIYLDTDGNVTFEKTPKLAFKKGDLFSSDHDGFNAFVKDTMIGRLKMADQSAYSVQNDVSAASEENGHWTYGQAIGVRNGLLRQRSTDESAARSNTEMGKRDPENLQRRSSRLMFGGEVMDQTDPRKREFVIGAQGANFLRDNYMKIAANFPRGRFNQDAAAALTTERSIKTLHRIAQSLEGQKVEVKPGEWQDGKKAFEDFIVELKNYSANSYQTMGDSFKKVVELLKEED